MNRYLVILLLMASPAAAELEPYKGSDGRIFPGLAPYWGAYTTRPITPRIGVDGGRTNPEYAAYEGCSACGTHGGAGDESNGGYDRDSGGVAIGGGFREAMQGSQTQGRGSSGPGGCGCGGAVSGPQVGRAGF